MMIPANETPTVAAFGWLMRAFFWALAAHGQATGGQHLYWQERPRITRKVVDDRDTGSESMDYVGLFARASIGKPIVKVFRQREKA